MNWSAFAIVQHLCCHFSWVSSLEYILLRGLTGKGIIQSYLSYRYKVTSVSIEETSSIDLWF